MPGSSPTRSSTSCVATLPHQRLIAQALILVYVTGMHITVGIDLLRLCRHRANPPHSPPLSLYARP